MPSREAQPARTLRGGILPPEHKSLSSETPIRAPALPERLVLPLLQHIGAPAEPVVAVGDRVRKGDLIAAARGWVSLPLHAPTSGRVLDIGEHPAPHPSGLPAPCILIEPDGDDRWGERQPLPHWREAAPERLLDRIREAGIAGLGGAGFPAAVKLSSSAERPIETLIVNGAECEPYITADDRLMRERAADIVEGLEILLHLVRPARCLIGIEDNKPAAIDAMRAALRAGQIDAGASVEVVVIPTRYPSGGEKQLIQILTGREVPSGGLPADLGILCQNVATALAVQRAILFGEPLISRITTLTGQALARPGNLEVLIGTPFAHLLDDAGVDRARLSRLIMGGPMMGFAVDDPAVGVVKTTNCVLAATADELPPPAPAQPCIRCGMCEQVCPASLLPQQLFWYARDGDLDAAREHHLADCIECGACAWVCPSAIPLVQYYRHAKGELRARSEDAARAELARDRFEFHQARIEAEQHAREAQRAARARKAAGRPARAAPTERDAPSEAAGEASRDRPQASPVQVAGERSPTQEPTATGSPPGASAIAPTAAQRRARLETLRSRRRRLDADLETARAAADSEASARLQERIEDLDRRIDDLQMEFGADADPGPGAATPYAGSDDADLARLDAEADRARGRARKARAALAALEQGGADARKIGAMRGSLERLDAAAAEAEAALARVRRDRDPDGER